MPKRKKKRKGYRLEPSIYDDAMCQGCHTVTYDLTNGYCEDCLEDCKEPTEWMEWDESEKRFKKV